MGTEYPKGHPQARVAAVIEALETAYIALETGHLLSPTPGFKPTRKDWGSKEGRERLISYLDAEFIHELTVHKLHWMARGMSKAPQLYRLDEPARIWLCEQLEAATKIPWTCMKDRGSSGETTCPNTSTMFCTYQGCGIYCCAEHGRWHGHSISTQSDMGYQWTLTCVEWKDKG